MTEGITRAEDWTVGEPDSKKDLTKAIKKEHVFHRKTILNSLDPDGKVWNEEERKEIMDTPPPALQEDFLDPLKYLRSKTR